MKWQADDIISGVAVSRPRGERYNPPALIVRIHGEDKNRGWGICELTDGLLIGLADKGAFGTKEDLANAFNEQGYFPLPKMLFKRDVETLPENRLGTPMLLMTHCGS
jgi:hypothetical protein